MADAWRGFDGTKEFESTEHELRLECRHDKKGTVECRVTRRRPWAPAWSFEALIDVGAGAHLDRIARDAEGFADRTTT